MTSTTLRRGRAFVAAAGLCTLLVAGCGGGGGGGNSGASSADQAAGGGQASLADRGSPEIAPPGTVAKESDARQVDVVAPTDRKLTKTAELTIRVDKVKDSAAKVRTIAERAHGYVTEEHVGDDDRRVIPSEDLGGEASITLAVPADRLDATLEQLASVGTVTERSTTTSDVTKEYVDTASRIRTMQTSVDRLRRLMKDAADLDQVTSLESALTTREANLESLKSQMHALEGQVAMSTVTVSLSTTAVPAEPASTAPSGFVEGLATGWHAFTTAVVGVVTLLGILLPFLVIVVVVGVPLLVLLRRRRAVSGGSTPAPAP